MTRNDEPVTDTVMQVLGRRLRAARKKMQKVTAMESHLEQNEQRQDEQDRISTKKGPLNAVIEELTKVEPLIEAALMNEMATYKEKLYQEFLVEQKQDEQQQQQQQHQHQQQAESSQAIAESSRTDAVDEGTSQQGILPSDNETGLPDVTDEEKGLSLTDEPVITQVPAAESAAIESIIEALYLSQLIGKEQFDISSIISKDHENQSDNSLSQEEVKILIDFDKKVFQSNLSVAQEGIQAAKDAALSFLSRSTPDFQKVYEIVEKLKSSEFIHQELKLRVHEFPIIVDTEVSDSTVEEGFEKTMEKGEPENESKEPVREPSMNQNTIEIGSDAVPMLSTLPMMPFPHQIGGTGSNVKAHRPFLPFPGMAMTNTPPVGLVMTQPPHVVGVHPYFSVARGVPGPYMQASLYYPPPQMPTVTVSNPVPTQAPEPSTESHTETDPLNTEGKVEEQETQEEQKKGLESEPRADTEANEETKEETEKVNEHSKSHVEETEVQNTGQRPADSFDNRGGNGGGGSGAQQTIRDVPSTGGEHRTPWRGRGRSHRNRDGGSGRGGGGRHSGRGDGYYHGSPSHFSTSRRPPYDGARPSHRPPFMQPRDSSARSRPGYEPRPRYRRNP